MASLEFMEDLPTNTHTIQQQQATSMTSTSIQPMGLNEKEDSLSPAVPGFVHVPLCRQAAPVPGLRYRNLGKSGLRISNVGLGTFVLLPFSDPVRVTPDK